MVETEFRRNIIIKKSSRKFIEEQDIEIVERKGLGHPDTICDACCDAASLALSKYYLDKFGHVLHHNLDKGLLIAGKAKPKFGGGKIIKPIKIIVAGRATDKIKNKNIPVKKIIKEAVQKWLYKNLNISYTDLVNFFKIQIDYKPGSADLQEVFTRAKEKPIANDTSFGVSHAPLSKTEHIVLQTANLLNSKKFIKKFPAVGRDIKVMGLRKKNKIKLIIAIAFIDYFIPSIKKYFEIKEKVKNKIYEKIKFNNNIEVEINTLDDLNAKKEADIYLTVSGLSAEQGDDGQVGRGNRVNGLITPCRNMSLEACAGKNINHPGKLYQILSYIIAQEIAKIKQVKECFVHLLSEIGKPLDEPQIVSVEIVSNASDEDFKKIEQEAKNIINKVLDNLEEIQRDIAFGKYKIY